MNLPTNETSQQVPADYFGIRIPFLEFLGVVPEYAKNGRSRMKSCSDVLFYIVQMHTFYIVKMHTFYIVKM